MKITAFCSEFHGEVDSGPRVPPDKKRFKTFCLLKKVASNQNIGIYFPKCKPYIISDSPHDSKPQKRSLSALRLLAVSLRLSTGLRACRSSEYGIPLLEDSTFPRKLESCHVEMTIISRVWTYILGEFWLYQVCVCVCAWITIVSKLSELVFPRMQFFFLQWTWYCNHFL